MKTGFQLLLVGAEGARVVRCHVPRWLVYGALASVAATAAVTVVLAGDYARARIAAGEVSTLRRHIEQQRHALSRFQARIAAVGRDIGEWTALHTKMWKALGSDAGRIDLRTGLLGEGTTMATSAGGPGPDDLHLLTTRIAEEGPRLRELERMVRRTSKVMRSLPLRWPVRGRVSSGYGVRPSPWTGAPTRHQGIDIGIPAGTPVRSPAPGTVTTATSGGGYGRYVRVDHGNGVTSLYGHLQRIDVRAGQRVEKGHVLGLAGSTGRSTGPHLHYELSVEGKAVDPRAFLAAR